MNETFHPNQHQGTVWYVTRNTPNGIYLHTYVEIDRNMKGNVTVCSSCWWDKLANKPKVPFRGTTLEFDIKDLLTPEQMAKRIMECKTTLHPATHIAFCV